MDYLIYRISFRDACPCSEAFINTYLYTDVRTVDDPKKIELLSYEGNVSWWYGEGKNHRAQQGYIMRDFIRQGWFVTLTTLEDLNEFIKKYGKVVIKPPSLDGPQEWILEIYDYYRE